MLKSLVRSALGRAGYDVVPSGCAANLAFIEAVKPHVQRASTVIDVGANTGQCRDWLRTELDYRGKIISFEPSPGDFAHILERSKGDPAWEVHPFAIGAEAGTLPLNIMAGTDFSSFRNPVGDLFADNRVERTVDVQVITLDSLGLEAEYLKTDTQGFDLAVLKGASKLLESLPAFQCEVSVIPIYEGLPSFSETMAELQSYGFGVGAMKPISYSRGRVIEFDCLMLR